MKFDDLVGTLGKTGDLGAAIRQELEEGISPITVRVDKLEKKIDMLILLMRKVDEKLEQLKPLTDLLLKLPLFRK